MVIFWQQTHPYSVTNLDPYSGNNAHPNCSHVLAINFIHILEIHILAINPYKPIVLFVGHRQTVQTQTSRRKKRRLIRVSTVYVQNIL